MEPANNFVGPIIGAVVGAFSVGIYSPLRRKIGTIVKVGWLAKLVAVAGCILLFLSLFIGLSLGFGL